MTFNIELNHKPKADQTHSLLLRVTIKRQIKRKSINRSIFKKDFNSKARYGKWINTSCYNHKQLNKHLKSVLSRAEDTHSELLKRGADISFNSFFSLYDKEDSMPSFIDFMKMEVVRYEAQNKIREADKILCTIDKMTKFNKGRDIKFSDLTYDFLSEYEKHLREVRGNGQNTIFNNMKVIKRRVFNAIKDEIISYDNNPFLKYSIKGQPVKKERLTIDEISKLENLAIQSKKPLWHVRNYFLFSLYMAGIRFSDLAQLKWDNINNGRLEYRMDKTKDITSLELHKKALQILDLYKERQDSEEYIFPIIDTKKEILNLRGFKKHISSRNALINKHLKKLMPLINTKTNISTHIARHSFSSLAIANDVPVTTLQSLLGHSDLKTTQMYLASLKTDKKDAALNKIFS